MAKRSSNEIIGFVQHLSPQKKSRKNNQFYTLQMQTGQSKSEKIIAYNMRKYNELVELAEAKSPVKMLAYEKEDHRVFGDGCYIQKVKPFDVDFDYQDMENITSSSQCSFKSTPVKISELKQYSVGSQLFDINNAHLSIGDNEIKVTKMGKVKEDCALEDASGIIPLHVWEETLKNLTTGTYDFKYLSYKQYQGEVYLVSTRLTTVSKVTEDAYISSSYEVEQAVQTLSVKEFLSVSNTEIYYSCRKCKKKIGITQKQNLAKCGGCGTASKVSCMQRDASCSVEFVTEDGVTIEGVVFTDVISKVLAANISEEGDSQNLQVAGETHIEEAFISLEDVVLKMKKKKIVEIKIEEHEDYE